MFPLAVIKPLQSRTQVAIHAEQIEEQASQSFSLGSGRGFWSSSYSEEILVIN